jgi:membrane protein required for colicin V production
MTAVEISYVDFFIVLLTVIFGYEGYRSGFFNGILSIGGIFISLIITLVALPYSARFYNVVIELSLNVSILMGFVTILVISLLLHSLFLQWLHTIMKMEVVDWFNRISGILLGLYKGLLILSLLALSFAFLPLPDEIKYAEEHSKFLQPVKRFMPANYNYFRKLVPRSPSVEEALTNTFTTLGVPEETAAAIMESFKSKSLDNSVTTTP